MPVISRFNGIVVKMYFCQSEHNPPHIHAIYGECVVVIDIQTGKMIEGDLPDRILVIVCQWTSRYRTDLLDIWETQKFRTLPAM